MALVAFGRFHEVKMKFTCHYKIAFKCCSAAPPNAPQETVVGLTISASGLSFFKMMIYYYCSTLLAYLFKNASIFPYYL